MKLRKIVNAQGKWPAKWPESARGALNVMRATNTATHRALCELGWPHREGTEQAVRGIQRPMRRYYFDMRNGDRLTVDEEGVELPDLTAAQQEAALALADMLLDESLNPAKISVEVRDDAGTVMRVRLVFNIDRTD
jgi:hypothetical protein